MTTSTTGQRARAYLQSIITTCATLQHHTDDELARAVESLGKVDDLFDDVTYDIDQEG